jgi:hypothetical protein
MTAPEARLYKKARGQESKLSFLGHVLTEHRTVRAWRRRYRAEGLAGVRTRPRTGRKKRITAATERAVAAATMLRAGGGARRRLHRGPVRYLMVPQRRAQLRQLHTSR